MTEVNLAWDDAPTLDEMKYHRDELDSEWNMSTTDEPSLDQQQKDEEDLYFQNFDVYAPEDRWIVKTGSAPADSDAAVDTMVPTEIGVNVRPLKGKIKYDDQADKLMKLGYGLLHAWRSDNDVIRDLVTDMVVKRYAVGRVLYDDTLWPKVPKSVPEGYDSMDYWMALNRRKCPIVLERREPRHCRWLEDDRHSIIVMVEHYETTVMEALDKWRHLAPALRILKGRELHDKIEVSDIWKGRYRSVMLEDEPIFPVGSGKKKGGSKKGKKRSQRRQPQYTYGIGMPEAGGEGADEVAGGGMGGVNQGPEEFLIHREQPDRFRCHDEGRCRLMVNHRHLSDALAGTEGRRWFAQ